MNADQVIEGIGNVVAAAKPAQEYCLLWIDWWPMCMNKAEWAAWAQVIGVIGALLTPFISNLYKQANAKRTSREIGEQIAENILYLDIAIDKLNEEKYFNNPQEKQRYLARSFVNILRLSGFQGEALSRVSHSIHTRLLSAEASLFDDIEAFNADCKKTEWELNSQFYGVCVDYADKILRHRQHLRFILRNLEQILMQDIFKSDKDEH